MIATLVSVTGVSCSENKIVISSSRSTPAPKKSMHASSRKIATVALDTPCELYRLGGVEFHLFEDAADEFGFGGRREGPKTQTLPKKKKERKRKKEKMTKTKFTVSLFWPNFLNPQNPNQRTPKT